jgi:hypothetical protein
MKNQNPVKRKKTVAKSTGKNKKKTTVRSATKKPEKEFDTLDPVDDELETDETSTKIRSRDEDRNAYTNDHGSEEIGNERELEEDEETPEITDEDDSDQPKA